MRPQLLAPNSGHYEAASDQGAENWACIASLIETCKLCGVEPQAGLQGLQCNNQSGLSRPRLKRV